MNRTPARARRAASLVLAFGAALGLTAAIVPTVTAAPAAPAACKLRGEIDYNNPDNEVVAFRARVCAPGGETTLLKTTLFRDGVKVAEGVGFARYHCQGTEVGRFTATGALPENHPCG